MLEILNENIDTLRHFFIQRKGHPTPYKHEWLQTNQSIITNLVLWLPNNYVVLLTNYCNMKGLCPQNKDTTLLHFGWIHLNLIIYEKLKCCRITVWYCDADHCWPIIYHTKWFWKNINTTWIIWISFLQFDERDAP